MTTAFIVHQKRTASTAAAWVLREYCLKRYDSVVVTDDQLTLPAVDIVGSDVYFISDVPSVRTLVTVFNTAARIMYLAKMTLPIHRRYQSHLRIPNFGYYSDDKLNIVEIVARYTETNLDEAPSIIQILAHRDEDALLTDMVFIAMSVATPPMLIIEQCIADESIIYKLTFAGSLLETRHNDTLGKIYGNQTFKARFRGFDEPLFLTVTPRHLMSTMALSLAQTTGYGVCCYDDPDGYRYFEMASTDSSGLDILAIGSKYEGMTGTKRSCRFRIPLSQSLKMLELK